MSQTTFRDFAGALMNGDDAAAAGVLEALLGLDAAGARAATQHFRARMAESPDFVPKAMGMRYVVERRDESELAALLVDCFGLASDAARAAAAVVLAQHQPPAR